MRHYRVKQERRHWANPTERLGWYLYVDRPSGGYPTISWHPTWELAMETANWLAYYGRGH